MSIPSTTPPSWMSKYDQGDWKAILEKREDIIAGFLGIGKKDGWKDGGYTVQGLRFTHLMLKKFSILHSSDSSTQTVLKRAVEALRSSFANTKPSTTICPKTRYDSEIYGWPGHAVSRLTGSLSNQGLHNAPSFEVLVNSASTSPGTPNFPFRVSVYKNDSKLQQRTKILKYASLQKAPVAEGLFYHPTLLESPSSFKAKHPEINFGPNSSRTLQALSFLNLQKMKSQTVGNCWLKQPKRSILASLFLDTVALNPHLSDEDAWKQSKNLYREWKLFVGKEIQEIFQNNTCDPHLKAVAEKKIAKRLEKARKEHLASQAPPASPSPKKEPAPPSPKKEKEKPGFFKKIWSFGSFAFSFCKLAFSFLVKILIP